MGSSRKKTPQPQPQQKSQIPEHLVRPAGILFGALVILRLIAAQLPEARLWGLSVGGYLPLWVQLMLAAVGLLFCTPLMYRFYLWKADLLDTWKPLPIALLAAAAGAALFWSFSMETYFLGDGAVYLAEHFRYIRNLPVSEDVLFSRGSAPLSAWLLAQGALLFADPSATGTLSAQPLLVFWISGALYGALFMAAVFLLGSKVVKDGSTRLGLVALLLLTPGSLFFFGYVEYYTLSFILLGIYLLSSYAVVKKVMTPIWLIVIFIIMAAAHIMTIVLLPGLLITLLAASGKERWEKFLSLKHLLLFTTGTLVVGAVYYFASGIATEGSRAILSLSPFGEGNTLQNYTLLSVEHLADVLNMLALVSVPAALALFFVPWKGKSWTAMELASLAHVLFLGFLLFFGYTSFGMARDWDVNAGFGLASSMFVFIMLQRTEKKQGAYLLYLAAGATMIAVLPWIAVNLNTDHSVQRFRHIMALDEENIPGDYALNGYEHLRKYYQSTGDREALAWTVRKKVDMVGYPQDFRKLMLAVMQGVDQQDQKEYVDWMFAELNDKLRMMQQQKTDSLYEGRRIDFIEIVAEFALQAPVIPAIQPVSEQYVANRLTELRSTVGSHPLADLVEEQFRWISDGDQPNAAVFQAAADAIENSTYLCVSCGRALLAAKRYEDAERILKRSLAIDDQFTLPHFILGEMFATRPPPEIDSALHHLQIFLTSPESSYGVDANLAQQLKERTRHLLAMLETQRLQLP